MFIDYERAFDTVSRDALWFKLTQIGVSCKFLNMLKSMYAEVKSCVRVSPDMEISDFFDVKLGLKQGEPLSPLLFILFVNDIRENLEINALTNNDCELLSKYLILFADDIVLFTTDPVSLQKQIDAVQRYSLKWGLKINVAKTKVCIFEKRKQLIHGDLVISGEKIERVDYFTYLGVKFKYTGSMCDAVKLLSEQGLKAYHNLLILFVKVKFDVKTKLNLFDTMVAPILL